MAETHTHTNNKYKYTAKMIAYTGGTLCGIFALVTGRSHVH